MCLCVCPPLHLKSAISITGDCHLSAAVRPVFERRPPGYLFVFVFTPPNAFYWHDRALMKYYKPTAPSVHLTKLSDTMKPLVGGDTGAQRLYSRQLHMLY